MKRLLVDGHNLSTRAFYTGNLFNFFNMIRSVLSDVEPDCFIIVFDDARSSWRRKLYPPYKDNRQEKPQDLITYLDILPRSLINAHIPFAIWDEADDYLYTVTRTNDHMDYILSSDKDLFGAVTDTTHVISFKSNFGDREVITEKRVHEIIGVPPNRYSLYKTLVGDPSDNVGGVSKIGPVKALDILNNYAPGSRTVSELYDCVDHIPQKYLNLLIPEYNNALKFETILSLRNCLDLDNRPVTWDAKRQSPRHFREAIEAAVKSFQARAEKHPSLKEMMGVGVR
jgi:DNA polymerase-1